MGRKKSAKIINFSTYSAYSLNQNIAEEEKKKSRNSKPNKKNIKNDTMIRKNNRATESRKEGKKINIKLILFILLIIGICCFCLFTPAFNVSSIKIEGIDENEYIEPIDNQENVEDDSKTNNENGEEDKETIDALNTTNHYSKQEIIDMSGIVIGTNIFKMNLSSIEKNIEKAPYIKKATITRVLPSTIKIKIEERIIRAYVDYIGAYMCIDETGYCVDSIKKDDKKNSNIPIIRGINPDDSSKGFIIGEMLNADDNIKLQRVVNVLNLIDKNELNLDISEIDVTNKDNVMVVINNGDIKIDFGDMSNMNVKIPFLPAILKDKEGKKGIIYMNSDSDNIQPIFSEIIGG